MLDFNFWVSSVCAHYNNSNPNYEMESKSKMFNVQSRTNFDQFKKTRKNYIDSQLFDLDGIHVKITFEEMFLLYNSVKEVKLGWTQSIRLLGFIFIPHTNLNEHC